MRSADMLRYAGFGQPEEPFPQPPLRRSSLSVGENVTVLAGFRLLNLGRKLISKCGEAELQ